MIFRKITTDFEDRLKHQVNIILCAFFFTLPTSPYPTEQRQSILEPEIPSNLHTSGFGAKILSAVVPYGSMLKAHLPELSCFALLHRPNSMSDCIKTFGGFD